MIFVIFKISDSKTPCVDGYVIINAPNLLLNLIAFSSKSVISIFPFSDEFTTTTSIPAITALAGFVPCADDGIRHIFLSKSPLFS